MVALTLFILLKVALILSYFCLLHLCCYLKFMKKIQCVRQVVFSWRSRRIWHKMTSTGSSRIFCKILRNILLQYSLFLIFIHKTGGIIMFKEPKKRTGWKLILWANFPSILPWLINRTVFFYQYFRFTNYIWSNYFHYSIYLKEGYKNCFQTEKLMILFQLKQRDVIKCSWHAVNNMSLFPPVLDFDVAKNYICLVRWHLLLQSFYNLFF